MMNSKLRKLKREAIPFLIMYVVVDILIVATFVYTAHQYVDANSFDRIKGICGDFFNNLIGFKFLTVFFVDLLGFIKASIYTFIAFVVMFIAWKIKFAKTYEYEGIEHGSSEWAKNGEEFDKLDDGREILNRKDGFILSKNHYLGTDLKKVVINKNILVVGRFWCG